LDIRETLSPQGLVFAYWLDGKGGGLALDPPSALVPGEAILSAAHWLHFDGRHRGAVEWLREDSGLDPVVVEGLLGRNPRPRVWVNGNEVLLSLRGLSMEPSAPADDMLSVQVWTNGGPIITCRDRPARAIADLRRDIEHGHGPNDTGEFLSQLAERLVSAMDDLIAEAEADTDRLGHGGSRHDTGALVEELAGIRRRMIRLGRYLGPQRRALSHLAASPLPWLSLEDRALLHATAEQTAEYEDSLRSALEVAEITQDELLQRSSEKTEQRVYVLTLISAVFMPLSFVTGLFGVNLAGIPAAEDPLSFAALGASLLVLVAVELWIFKRQGWF
jgi:zinc transporter